MLSKCCGKCERAEQAHRREFLQKNPPRCSLCGTIMVRINVEKPEDEKRMWLLAKKAAFQRNAFNLYESKREA
jgi:hypothetical protein